MVVALSPPLLDRLGYQDFPEALHRPNNPVDRTHPYAPELIHVLTSTGKEKVLGIYDIDGVPAVCLIVGEPGASVDGYSALRAQLWNQGLISLLLVVGEDAVQAWPVAPDMAPADPIEASHLDRGIAYSAYGARSGALQTLHPHWFDSKSRVDKVLLRNLMVAIDKLAPGNSADMRLDAQHLMAQVLFVSYLEDRGLINADFRRAKHVLPFSQLLTQRDRAGLEHLFVELKERFNGDFLTPTQHQLNWSTLSDEGFSIVDHFLQREELLDGQQSIWRYDFRHIPVELLSSLYETFLADRQKKDGAYYTPRHLANLVVDEAFRDIDNPDEEIVWDGACGSGILLTTAFRRMLGVAEHRAGRQLSLAERSTLLQSHIYGGDINAAACKIAAFSLYLCLLEDLPTIPKTKLPQLLGKNIFDRQASGDVFSDQHPIVTGKVPPPSILVSNPPWREPPGKELAQTYEQWANDRAIPLHIPLRQIATAYAYRATELVRPGGRICLIMPAGTFARPQHRKFLEGWLERVKLTRLINFSDLRMLLFPGAKHPCMVVVAHQAPPADALSPPAIFEYVTPKADVGLLYNRLTVHSSDCRKLAQSQIALNSTAIQGLYWGSQSELAEVERLCLSGTFASVIARTKGTSGSGFHLSDGSKAVSPGFLKNIPHIAAPHLPKTGPQLPQECLQPWPRAFKHVAGLGQKALYEGARVIVPNGMTPDHRIRAFALEQTASVSNSCSVLRLGINDLSLARFASAYLSSRLGAYLALLLAPSAVMERTQIKHGELLNLPFRLPEQHSDPALGLVIVKSVAAWVEKQEQSLLVSANPDLPTDIEQLIHAYFELSPTLQQIVTEVADTVLPNMQPTTVENIVSPLNAAPTSVELERYAQTVISELERHSKRLGGIGSFQARVDFWRPESHEGLGRITVRASTTTGIKSAGVHDEAIEALLEDLRTHGLLSGVFKGGLAIRGDVLVQNGDTLHFAKPLVRRLWLTSAALDDAQRIVRHVHVKRVGG